MPTVNFPKLSSSEAEERTNAVSEPAVLLASLIPEDLPKRERERKRGGGRGGEVPFQRNDNWLSYTCEEEEEEDDDEEEMLCPVTLHASRSRVILAVLRSSRKWYTMGYVTRGSLYLMSGK